MTATCDGKACGLVCAADCPDQLIASCTGSNSLGASINEVDRFVGQTYTADRTGMLSGVAISVQPAQTQYNLRVSIRDTSNGLPGQTVLGSTTLGSSSTTLSNTIQFSPPIQHVAGQQYAIVVDYPDAPGPGLGYCMGTWDGSGTDCYAGGAYVFSADGTVWKTKNYELHFQVFMKGS